MSTYLLLKVHAQPIAETSAKMSQEEARSEGYKDVYDFLMSDDSDHRHYVFLIELSKVFSVSERKTLLNGLAIEYADVDGWLAYVDRDRRRVFRESRCHAEQ